MILGKLWKSLAAQMNKIANFFWTADPIAQLQYEYDKAVDQMKDGREGLFLVPLRIKPGRIVRRQRFGFVALRQVLFAVRKMMLQTMCLSVQTVHQLARTCMVD